MIQILPLANILYEETMLEDDFRNHTEGWELIEDEQEKSFIKDSNYWMENKSNDRWMFYHKKLPVTSKENFVIRTEKNTTGLEYAIYYTGYIIGYNI